MHKKKFVLYFISLFCCMATGCQAVPTREIDFVNGFNSYGFQLYPQLNSTPQNTIFSPYSLSSALALLGMAASGETQMQIYQSLQIPISSPDLSKRLDNLSEAVIAQSNDQQTLDIANGIWVQEDLKIKADFLKQMNAMQTGQFFPINFSLDPNKARVQINQWVEKITRNNITDLIPEGVITNATKLVLTNAIYFKGLWQKPFNENETKDNLFYKEDNSTVKVPLMYHQTSLAYFENDLFQMVTLPYSKSHMAMAVFVPKTKHTAQEVFKTLNNATFTQILTNREDAKVRFYLPRFKIASTFDNLINALKSLKIQAAFSDKANFSNLTDMSIAVSDVIQRAMVEVDEKGTVAAAATAVTAMATAMPMPDTSVIVRADHPFVFILFDEKTKMILFMGQVMDPSVG